MDSKIPTKKETDSRTEINKQQTKRIIMYFSCQEEEKKKHKQSITDGNPTIIGLHAPHHMEEVIVAHLGR
jgi:hypothetical protein